MPIELRAAVAARAAGGKRRFVAKHFAAGAAPGAGLHGFRHRPVAAAALEVRFQLPAELPLKLLLADFLPMPLRGGLGFLRPASLRAVTQHFGLRTQVGGQHLAAVFEPPAGLQLQRALQQRDHVRVQHRLAAGRSPPAAIRTATPAAGRKTSATARARWRTRRDRRDGRPIACSGAM